MHVFTTSRLIRFATFLLFTATLSKAQNTTIDHSQPAQRVPAIDPTPGSNALADSIRVAHNGTLRVLDKALLNSPAFAAGRGAFFSQVRYNSTVPGDIRELTILRVAALQGAAYEWILHESVGRAQNLTVDQLKLIRDPAFSPWGNITSVFNAQQIAAIKFIDQSTKISHISNEVWAGIQENFPSAQAQTELVLTSAAYALVSRFLLAVSVDGIAEMQVPYPV